MVNGNNFSEYYFDYDLEQGVVDGSAGASDIKSPKLYFERDYRKKNLPYSLTVVPYEWLERIELYNSISQENDAQKNKAALAELPYDSVRVIFAVGGVDYRPLLDPSSNGFKSAADNRTYTFKDFHQTGCTIVIDDRAEERSGVGVIEMIKDGKNVARFVFIVNCIKRKKISYYMTKKDDSLIIRFVCKDRPEGIKVSLVHNSSRLPCLKEDREHNTVSTFTLAFKPNGEYGVGFPIKDEAHSRHIFSLAFTNDELNKYYILDCKRNDTLDHVQKFDALVDTGDRSCPYCHNVISLAGGGNDKYKSGGAPCRPFVPTTAMLPTVYSSKIAKYKNCMYCVDDLIPYNPEENNTEDMGRFDVNFLRLFPADFMAHQEFKIAFVGSARAGKSTYISRFFGITGTSRQASMPMTSTANGLKPFGIDIQTAVVEQVEAARSINPRERRYEATKRSWADLESQYIARRITLLPSPYYVGPTSTGDYTRYPFIAEVNKKAYVSFYDVAGEDAQSRMQIRDIANTRPIGVFCIINGESDANGNNNVINMLRNAELNNSCPIAVIVTKMDNLEKHFDANCRCLKTDYFGKLRRYTGSELEREIDFSSEEIKSYLIQAGLFPDFGTQYRNVKFFGVSSFNFCDSIHKREESLNAPGNVYFECSSKHLELPFVWMMKQFGLIS